MSKRPYLYSGKDNQSTDNMKNKETAVCRIGLVYVAPAVESIPLVSENVLCESPLPGGNEGIGFENWN